MSHYDLTLIGGAQAGAAAGRASRRAGVARR